jgi:hypothetical protein
LNVLLAPFERAADTLVERAADTLVESAADIT